LDENHKDAIDLLEEVEHVLAQTKQTSLNEKECVLGPRPECESNEYR
jgi:hypothetical protein